jgi:hypothetical protein
MRRGCGRFRAETACGNAHSRNGIAGIGIPFSHKKGVHCENAYQTACKSLIYNKLPILAMILAGMGTLRAHSGILAKRYHYAGMRMNNFRIEWENEDLP